MDYFDSLEGKYLPILHCVQHTSGWEVNEKIMKAAKSNKNATIVMLNKGQFGAGNSLVATIMNTMKPVEEIHICGTCTDICVVSNALPLKASFSETPIYLHENLCAGLTAEKHAAAVEVMKSCQIEVLTDD
jgi:nicotinamidase-related amidase